MDASDLPGVDDCAIEDSDENPLPALSIEELGMLIRSATTFLSITDQQLSRPSARSSSDSPNTRTLRLADRLATLFVCKTRAVAAVAFSYHAQAAVVYSVSETHSYDDNNDDGLPSIEQVFCVKNSKGINEKEDDQRIQPPYKAQASPGKPYGEKWISGYLKS
jgi:chemotaxis signal transduction protein